MIVDVAGRAYAGNCRDRRHQPARVGVHARRTERRHLLACTAPTANAAEAAAQPAARLEIVEVDVPGAGIP